MIIENKTIYLAIDMITDLVKYFRRPFDGSDY